VVINLYRDNYTGQSEANIAVGSEEERKVSAVKKFDALHRLERR
jgi:hypothetical protein